MLKPTFVSKIEQYLNIFSQFTTFCEKNNRNFKNFTKNNKKIFFQLKNNFTGEIKNNFTGEKKFLLSLRKLDG